MAVCLEYIGEPQLQPDMATMATIMESCSSRLPDWVGVSGNRLYETEDCRHLTVEAVSQALGTVLDVLDCQKSDCLSVDDFEVKTD